MYSEALVREVLHNKNGTLGLWWDTHGWECQVWNVRSWAGQTALLAGAFSRARGFQLMNYEQSHDFPFYSSSFILGEMFWILISCPLILRNSKIKVSKWTGVLRRFSKCSHARESLMGQLHPSQGLWSHTGLMPYSFSPLRRKATGYLSAEGNTGVCSSCWVRVFMSLCQELRILHILYLWGCGCESTGHLFAAFALREWPCLLQCPRLQQPARASSRWCFLWSEPIRDTHSQLVVRWDEGVCGIWTEVFFVHFKRSQGTFET